jgi:hypothetical protein
MTGETTVPREHLLVCFMVTDAPIRTGYVARGDRSGAYRRDQNGHPSFNKERREPMNMEEILVAFGDKDELPDGTWH